MCTLSRASRHTPVTPARGRSFQGPSGCHWGGAWVVSGTGPGEALREDWLQRRALVLGLARSGRAAALALARRGVEVVAADRSERADPGRLAAAGVEVRLGSEEAALLAGVELGVKSPGVPGESPRATAARARGRPGWTAFERADPVRRGQPLGCV